ncbi:hypothetical protein DVH24_001952 [Malus domestica]|uniref:MULE transposase domain-containing protein n=1 Tax=Malus domestica TaxID=3750 RepID=A0A498I8D1_MALDO|nr:hypothetical protein DVH24_001952 [Malus domestica]
MSIVKVLKCVCENYAVVVPLYLHISYEDLCEQLTLRFPSLSLRCLLLKYLLDGGESNCLLECNEDIQTLLLVNNLISNLVVDVYVQAKKEMYIVSISEIFHTSFVEHLARILNYQRRKITFITDQHHGLLNAIQKYLPTASHGFSIIHLRENLERQCVDNNFLKDQLCEYFKNCAYACRVEDFDRNIEKMRSVGGYISEEHRMLILDLIESIRGRLMVMIFDRRCVSEKWFFFHKGFSCAHALQVILHNHRDIEDFVDDYWKFPIVLVFDLNKPAFDLLNTPVKPPLTRRQGGRSRIHCYKSKNETRCNQYQLIESCKIGWHEFWGVVP